MDITIPVPQVPPFSPLCIFRALTVPFPVTPLPTIQKKKNSSDLKIDLGVSFLP